MIILLFVIVPKRLDPYYQADIARKDLAILREEKRRNNSRNIIAIIVLPLSPPLSPLLTPKPLESEIPAKYLDYKPKALDLPNLTEPKPNIPRKQFTPRFLGRTIY
jgi:hypothetical protein